MLKTRGEGLRVLGVITITCHDDGSMKVEGPIQDKAWCLAVLDGARDAVNGHHRPRSELVVPGSDLGIPSAKIVLP